MNTPAELIEQARGLARSIADFPVNQCLLDIADALERAERDRKALRLSILRAADEVDERESRTDDNTIRALETAQLSAALDHEHAQALTTALRDCLSTFRFDDKSTVITADRQEMWQHVLATHGVPA